MISRKGNIAAYNFLKDLGIKHPTDLPIEDIAFSQGAFVENQNLEGCEGRIVFDGDEAVITVDNNISYEAKRRFVIAHELGHFKMHRTLQPGFIDNEKTLNVWYAKGSHELEANSFAAELLMPESLVMPKFKGRKFTLDIAYEVSKEFNTSITSTLLRYKDLGDYPMALIMVKKGVVEWSQFTADFPLSFLPKGSKVSPNTVVGDYFSRGNELEENPEKIPALEWFPEDFDIEKYENWEFYEQGFHVAKDSVLVCLWTF